MRLAYDGTDFLGWQRQASGRTVQSVIEGMLTRLAGDVHVGVTAAGRTDSGVHASAQIAHADIATMMSDDELLHALQRMSPPDIAIDALTTADASFHSRFTAWRRSYRYSIIRRADPFRARYAWHLEVPIDRERLADAAAKLIGRHDFTSLSKHNPDTTNPVCEIITATWSSDESELRFDVTADRFLYGMVRMLVGIQIDIARAQRDPDEITHVIAARDRAMQSQAAPARGLCLVGVDYPDGGPFKHRT